MASEALAGRLLVATPMLGDPNFRRTVVLVVEHEAEQGTLGVVLNRPTKVPVGQVLEPWTELVTDPSVVFTGGPVSPNSALALAHVPGTDEPVGWHPLDATKIRDVGKIVLACHALDRERLNFFAQVREQLGEEDRARFDAWLKTHAAETRVRGDEAKSRKFVVSLVEREMARLTAKATAHLEEDSSESAKLAAMYAFDSTEEGMKLKKSEKKQVRALLARLQGLCDSMNRTTLGN